MKRLYMILILISVAGACNPVVQDKSNKLISEKAKVASQQMGLNIHPVSLICLIANPEKYDGKKVCVVGYLRTDYDDTRLYLTQEHGEFWIRGNSIRVNFTEKTIFQPEEMNLQIQSYKRKYVYLYGIFDAKTESLLVECVSPRRPSEFKKLRLFFEKLYDKLFCPEYGGDWQDY